MKLLVFLEVGADVRIPPERDPRSGRVRQEWLVRELDPGSTGGLDLALRLKEAQPGTEVTAIHLGPAGNEPWLRHALARGCDRAVRVWDSEVDGSGAAGKAVILAAAAQAAGFDLILAGACGVLAASGQFGVLLAAHLMVPCVTQVVAVAPPVAATGETGPHLVEFTRGLDRGYRERVEAKLPIVATVAAAPAAAEASAAPSLSVAALLEARGQEIPVWDLADLGVPFDRVRRADEAFRAGSPQPVRPRLLPLSAPDAALPAFDRILKLVQGAVVRREGRVVRKPPEETVEEIFRTLKDEGWLDHLRPGQSGATRGPGEAGAADRS